MGGLEGLPSPPVRVDKENAIKSLPGNECPTNPEAYAYLIWRIGTGESEGPVYVVHRDNEHLTYTEFPADSVDAAKAFADAVNGRVFLTYHTTRYLDVTSGD